MEGKEVVRSAPWNFADNTKKTADDEEEEMKKVRTGQYRAEIVHLIQMQNVLFAVTPCYAFAASQS
jgi:hypothetical protein